jgi:peptidyl-prolyl cis-trans isomerase C
MHSKSLTGICLASLLALASWPVAAQTSTPGAEGDPVVAKINGATVHRSEVLRVKNSLPDQYRSYPIQMLYPVLLDQIIDSKLVAQEGRKDNLQDDQDVRQQMAFIEDRIIQEVYLNRYVQKSVTDDALQARYVEFLRLNPSEEEVRARHILLEDEATAKAVIEEVQGGVEFAEAAKERSTGPSAAQGGDLGFFGRNDVVPEFSEAAFGLDAGAMTEAPVQTKFGWHVIKVEEKRLSTPPSFDETREQLVAELSRDLVRDLVADLRDGATIERFNLDGSVMEEKEPVEEIERAPSDEDETPAEKESTD